MELVSDEELYSEEEGAGYYEEDEEELGDYSSDDEGDVEIDENGNDHVESDSKRQKQSREKYALPTKQEQMHLRETENLMRTNLLKLQVDEMLVEIKDSTYCIKNSLTTWLGELQSMLLSIGESISENVDLQWLQARDVLGIELDGYDASKLSIRFRPPTRVSVVGSFDHKTTMKPFLCIDLAVCMPSQCFDERDILNFGYFDKRKLYLGVIAHQLQQDGKLASQMQFSTIHGDFRRPILVVKPSVKTPYVVRIFPTLPLDAPGFPLKISQLRPSKNNVRPAYWMKTLRENETMRKSLLAKSKGKSGKKEGSPDAYSSSMLDSSSLPPTPCYNMAIIEDLILCATSKYAHDCLSICPCLRDAILLMKVWITQRGLNNGFDSIVEDDVIVLFIFLYTTKRVLPQMSPLLAFTAALKFIVESVFNTDVFEMVRSRSSTVDPFYQSEHRPAAALLIPMNNSRLATEDEDEEGSDSPVQSYNALWRWSHSSVQYLQSMAKRSLEILQSGSDASDFAFTELFIKKSYFLQKSDLFFHFPVQSRKKIMSLLSRGGSAQFEELGLDKSIDNALCDKSSWHYAAQQSWDILSKALGDRVIAIRTLSSPIADDSVASEMLNLSVPSTGHKSYCPVWAVNRSLSSDPHKYEGYVTIGIVLNREKSHQRVVRGPSADDEAGCIEFRHFWGSKSQLRRFHDGTIVEACVWGSDAHQSANQVPRGELITTEITLHILSRHLPLYCENNIRSVCNQLETFLPAAPDPISGLLLTPDKASGLFYPGAIDAATLCRRAVEAADALRTMITSKLQDMPLLVESVRLCSPELRYTSFFPPWTHPLVLSGGGEGKSAVKQHSGERVTSMVSVFPVVLNMHRSGKWPADLEALRKVKTAMLIRLSDNLKNQFQIRSIVHRDYIDAMFRGYVFRMFIYTENEVSLLMPNASSTGKPKPIAVTPGDHENNIDGQSRPDVSSAADELVRKLVIAPLHHSVIHSAHSKHPSLGDTVRLLSRWMSGHMFSDQLDHETLELIVASVYLDNKKDADQPHSATAGFLRALCRIAEFDWNEKPLIVDFTEDGMSSKDVSYIRSQFGTAKSGTMKQLPMHIVASYDKQRGYAPGFGLNRPERVVLRMICAAARASAEKLMIWMSKGFDDSALSLEQIFNSPFSIASKFNVVLKLNRSLICKAQRIGHSDGQNKWLAALNGPTAFHTTLYSNLSSRELSGGDLTFRDGPVPNSIAAECFRKIVEKFSSYAIFFWDSIDGDRIGVVWKPHTFMPKRFTVLESRLRLVVDGDEGKSTASSQNSSGATILNSVELVALMAAECNSLIDAVEFL